MFTGIIKEIGQIKRVVKTGSLSRFMVKAPSIYKEACVSDSIAVDGACLTLIYKENGCLFFEALASTLAVTTLKWAKIGDFVNLEPALRAGDKLGGHFVLGHVDCAVRIKALRRQGNYYRLEAELPRIAAKYVIDNGSVAIGGISLTVKTVSSLFFKLDIIPFTYDNTNLKYKKAGDKVNLECDYLLKGKRNNP